MVNIAVLWDDEVELEGGKPFREDIDHMNDTYSVFSRLAGRKGGNVFIGRFDSMDGSRLEEGYSWSEGSWSNVEDVEVDVVFDKYRFDDGTVSLKEELGGSLPVLNSLEVEEVCKDKFLTFRRFDDLVPEIRKADPEAVEQMIVSHGRVLVKPRYGYGGKGIEVLEDAEEYSHEEGMVVQRFLETEGMDFAGLEGPHDLRVYVLNGEILLSYLRIPDEGLLSNVHLGGSIKFVELEDLPGDVRDLVEQVDEELEDKYPAFYSVDMMQDSTGGYHVLELNSKPGLAFYGDREIRERKMPVMEKVTDLLVEMGDKG